MIPGVSCVSPDILFVDDDENILNSLKRLFMDENYSVYTSSSGAAGLELLRSQDSIGVVVSDQRMPGMNGIEFLERVKEVKPEVLRILLTGYGDLATIKDAINRGGAYRFITKPWLDDDLFQIIREARSRYVLHRENERLNNVISSQNVKLKCWNDELEQMVQKQTIELTRKNQRLEQLIRHQKATFKGIIESLSGLIELRDRRVRSHSRNVAELCSGIASSMKLSKEETEYTIIAAMLHDIGKIGIPDSILMKNVSDMDEAELNEYRLHPIRGQAALDCIEGIRRSGTIIRHHHENYDGTGYPDGLTGDEIPMGSRIIAVADYIDTAIDLRNPKALEFMLEDINLRLRTMFDPVLFKHIPNTLRSFVTRYKYRKDDVEEEISPAALKVGMVLSRDVKSGTGVLLLSKGARLSEKTIDSLRRLYHIDPSKNGIFVWANK